MPLPADELDRAGSNLWNAVPAGALDQMRVALETQALSIMRQFGFDPDATGADQQLLKTKYHQALLAALVQSTQPLWSDGFAGGAILDDLVAMLGDGGKPRLLSTEASNADKRIKETARTRFVLGVIYRAAKEGISRQMMLDRLGVGMGQDAWREWLALVPRERREAAADAARSHAEWHGAAIDSDLATLHRIGYGQALP